jgi:choline dehydrogenase-like flavoprotein
MIPPSLKASIKRGERLGAEERFDAIVVGSGAAGGLACLKLCEGGLNVLLLDAGMNTSIRKRPFTTATQFLTRVAANSPLAFRLARPVARLAQRALRAVGKLRQPIQTQCFAWERMPQAFVDDRDYPYATPSGRPFSWIRTHSLGGRMIVPGHGWQYYRLAQTDFRPASPHRPAWPITLEDLTPWYEDVETLLGLSGREDGFSCPPDSLISRRIDPDALEARLMAGVRLRWPQANIMMSRFAPPKASIALAAATGRLTCRTGAVVERILPDDSGRAGGAEWRDKRDGVLRSSRAPIIFLCASTIESTRILMASSTPDGRRPGEDSGVLGANLTDRIIVRAEGVINDTHHPVAPPPGRCLALPRFDLRDGGAGKERGYGVQLYTYPSGRSSFFTAVAFIEGSPRVSNHIRMTPDKGGSPVGLEIDYSYNEDDLKLTDEAASALRELGKSLGAVLTHVDTVPSTPGVAIHECGTARMGTDRQTSVLNPHNECWDMPGLFVTDGASFPSQGSQNPALTIMALTARACQHVLDKRAA